MLHCACLCKILEMDSNKCLSIFIRAFKWFLWYFISAKCTLKICYFSHVCRYYIHFNNEIFMVSQRKAMPKNAQVQFISVTQSCPTHCDTMNCSRPVLPVHHQLPEFTQTHVHWVGVAIQPSHPLSSPSASALKPSQHQSLFQWVNSSHEVAKILEFQL